MLVQEQERLVILCPEDCRRTSSMPRITGASFRQLAGTGLQYHLLWRAIPHSFPRSNVWSAAPFAADAAWSAPDIAAFALFESRQQLPVRFRMSSFKFPEKSTHNPSIHPHTHTHKVPQAPARARTHTHTHTHTQSTHTHTKHTQSTHSTHTQLGA